MRYAYALRSVDNRFDQQAQSPPEVAKSRVLRNTVAIPSIEPTLSLPSSTHYWRHVFRPPFSQKSSWVLWCIKDFTYPIRAFYDQVENLAKTLQLLQNTPEDNDSRTGPKHDVTEKAVLCRAYFDSLKERADQSPARGKTCECPDRGKVEV